MNPTCCTACRKTTGDVRAVALHLHEVDEGVATIKAQVAKVRRWPRDWEHLDPFEQHEYLQHASRAWQAATTAWQQVSSARVAPSPQMQEAA
jgi:hypothetical protein